MSLQSEIVQVLNQLYSKVYLSQPEPATRIVPVLQRMVPDNGDNTIYMDHERLPTPSNYTFFGQEVMAHNLGDVVYECMNQANSGSFHVVGAPGLFSIGAKVWITPYGASDLNITLQVIRTIEGDTFPAETVIKGSQQAQVFLSPGDMFRFRYDPSLNTDSQMWFSPSTEVLITRLSRNPYYAPEYPQLSFP